MKTNDLDDRINELEARLEFQDETIARLNDEMVVHQRRVFQLDKTLKLLIEQIQGKVFEAQDSMDPKDEPPPPHY